MSPCSNDHDYDFLVSMYTSCFFSFWLNCFYGCALYFIYVFIFIFVIEIAVVEMYHNILVTIHFSHFKSKPLPFYVIYIYIENK